MNERIRLIRDELNLSRAAFGEKLGVSGDVINNLERGRVEAKEPMIKLICSVYSVDEKWLRTGEGGDDAMFVPQPNDTLGAFIRERNLTPTDQILIEKFASLNATAREEVVNYVLKIAEALLDTRKPSFAQTDDAPKQKADAAATEVHKQVFLEEKAKAESSASPSDTGGAAGKKMA